MGGVANRSPGGALLVRTPGQELGSGLSHLPRGSSASLVSEDGRSSLDVAITDKGEPSVQSRSTR
jgi:hypothetical protein